MILYTWLYVGTLKFPRAHAQFCTHAKRRLITWPNLNMVGRTRRRLRVVVYTDIPVTWYIYNMYYISICLYTDSVTRQCKYIQLYAYSVRVPAGVYVHTNRRHARGWSSSRTRFARQLKLLHVLILINPMRRHRIMRGRRCAAYISCNNTRHNILS